MSSMTKLGMAIDLARCMGCQTCTNACKMENNVPMNMLWSRVITQGADIIDGATGVYPDLSREYLPIACQHCENPACLKVCPVGATYKDDEGRVLIDYERCIGCRYCMAACPYNARSFNWGEPVHDPGFRYGHKDVPVRHKGIAEKCTFCVERTGEGLEPMCVRCCPVKARIFGDLDDPASALSEAIRQRGGEQLMEEKGTAPQVYYLK